MYRVLFAEDELLVRLGLQNSIPWKEFGMEFAAEAENGVVAYEKFLQLRPEVVITDIRMEGMDGYELIRKIREIDDKCAIIIISCLDDFENLRKMMGYRIIGYILKSSMTMQEITEVMQNAKEYLDHNYSDVKQKISDKEDEAEKILAYLCGCSDETEEIQWKKETGMELSEISMVTMFRLTNADYGKINDLGMKLVAKLASQWIKGSYFLETGLFEFLVLEKMNYQDRIEAYDRFNAAVKEFLGVSFEHRYCECNGNLDSHVLEILKKQSSKENQQRNMKNDTIKKAVRYLEHNYQKSISLPDISKELGLSPNYFSVLFKKETGKNYVDYLNELRLNNVLKDLVNTKDKIQTVAERNGFANLEYFSRFFKKKMGVSPAKWRNENS